VLWACWVFLSFSYSGAQSATAKVIEIICFANFAIFYVCLIQIDFESKYSNKLCFLDSNAGGFDIPLYASPVTIGFASLGSQNKEKICESCISLQHYCDFQAKQLAVDASRIKPENKVFVKGQVFWQTRGMMNVCFYCSQWRRAREGWSIWPWSITIDEIPRD